MGALVWLYICNVNHRGSVPAQQGFGDLCRVQALKS